MATWPKMVIYGQNAHLAIYNKYGLVGNPWKGNWKVDQMRWPQVRRTPTPKALAQNRLTDIFPFYDLKHQNNKVIWETFALWMNHPTLPPVNAALFLAGSLDPWMFPPCLSGVWHGVHPVSIRIEFIQRVHPVTGFQCMQQHPPIEYPTRRPVVTKAARGRLRPNPVIYVTSIERLPICIMKYHKSVRNVGRNGNIEMMYSHGSPRSGHT